MRLTLVLLGLLAILTSAEPVKRASPKLVLSHYMLGDITEEHAHKDIDDAIAMGIDGFVLNVGYPKLEWVSKTLSHLYGYADYRGGFKLALSLDLYATGAYCYALKQKGDCNGDCNDCGGPMEYNDILKAFLGRDSYFQYGPNNLPFITTFSTGGKTNKDIKAWKEAFADKMYFMPGIDDTPGFWESHPAWWDYWEDLIDGASVWESAWPEVHGTNEGDMSRDLKVMKPLQKAGKGYMIAVSLLQYKNSYGANLYRRGEMNVIKRMENILAMDPQPDIVQLLTWNDGPESHHFGNIWPEQNTDKQPNQYASPLGSDHTGFQPLFSAFIHAWKNGGDMVPASLSKRSGGLVPRVDSIPQGALWHKSIFQSTTCPGGNSKVKYFQAPNGTDAGLDALHWALAVPVNAAGWVADVISDGKSISSTTLKAGLNYGTIEEGISAGTQRLLIRNGATIVAGTDRGRCLSEECHDGIYNFNPQIMGVKSGYDDRECWQVSGKAVLNFEDDGYITGVTQGPIDSDSSCQDTFGETSAPWMWSPLECSKQLNDWFSNTFNTGKFNEAHDDYNKWLPQFAQPMDSQSSHEDCSAWKFLVINSAAHLWEYFDLARTSIEDARGRFSVDKETYFELYWGNVAESLENRNQFLNAIAVALGTLITAASLATGMAPIALAGPAVGGLISVGILHQTTHEVNIGNKIKVETIGRTWLDGWGDVLQPVADDLTYGTGKSGDIDVQDIFKDGSWVLSNNKPILALSSSNDIGKALYHLILGAIINISWKSQNVYLACHDMTETEYQAQEKKGIRSGSNDTRLRFWYDGTGCFYQGVKPKSYIDGTYGYQIRPPGFGDLFEPNNPNNNPLDIPFDTHDIVISSLEGFKKGGFNYTLSDKDVTEALFNFGETSTVRDMARIPGFFQIPICWWKPWKGADLTHERELEVFFGNLAKVSTHDENGYLSDCWNKKDDWNR
ncbi:hypothetical protein FGRMN_11209 [Fusarium graminum]|nr:hypothetical protein FGRMN_11209 [Fusarium graminum]